MSTTRDADRDQPLPTPGHQLVQDALIAAVEERKAYGIRKYGRPLETHNGRDALTDAWEEALDLVTYLTQMRLERGDELPAAAPSAPADADLPAPGESYRHYKGGLYTVDALAEDTGTGVQRVVYHDEQQHHWTRPLSEFTGTVAGMRRFTLEGVLAGREQNPADADLRNRIARALAEITVGHKAFITVDVQAEYPRADAVLAALPAPADQAAALREAAAIAEQLPTPDCAEMSSLTNAWDCGTYAVAAELRRMADEAQQGSQP